MNTITSAPHPTTPQKATFLRAALLLDAAVTGANGLAYLLLPAHLTAFLGTSPLFLMAAGGFLFFCAIVFLLIGRASRIPPAGVWFAILVNAAWALASIVFVLTSDWLTQIGQVWGILQALAVLGFGIAQMMGWRRHRE